MTKDQRPTAPSALRPFLEAIYDRFHRLEHAEHDPLRLPRRYADRADREVVAFVSAAMAFGRVASFLKVLEALFGRLGPRPAATVAGLDLPAALAVAGDLRHRFVGPRELAGLLAALGRLVRERGGLRPAFDDGFVRTGDPVDGLASLAAAVRGAAPPGADPGFLVSAVGPASPAKRLCLFLRWMVRDDGLDLGDWRDVGSSRLLVPLDVHVLRLSRMLGLLPPRRSGPRLADARALTAALAAFDPADPVRFDFALSHLGISGACRGEAGGEGCARCVLAGVCVAVSPSENA